MSTKETNLPSVQASDLTANDRVRVLDNDSSRNITLTQFATAIKSELEANGFVTTASVTPDIGQSLKITNVSASVALVITNSVLLCNTSGGDITVTLPDASTAYDDTYTAGQKFTIKKTTADVNSVIIQALAGQAIDNSGVTLSGAYTTVTIISDGTNWWTI